MLSKELNQVWWWCFYPLEFLERFRLTCLRRDLSVFEDDLGAETPSVFVSREDSTSSSLALRRASFSFSILTSFYKASKHCVSLFWSDTILVFDSILIIRAKKRWRRLEHEGFYGSHN